MNSLPLAMTLATDATRRHAGSALPHAPVVPDEPRLPRAARTTRSRAALAGLLARAARRIEPTTYVPAR